MMEGSGLYLDSSSFQLLMTRCKLMALLAKSLWYISVGRLCVRTSQGGWTTIYTHTHFGTGSGKRFWGGGWLSIQMSRGKSKEVDIQRRQRQKIKAWYMGHEKNRDLFFPFGKGKKKTNMFDVYSGKTNRRIVWKNMQEIILAMIFRCRSFSYFGTKITRRNSLCSPYSPLLPSSSSLRSSCDAPH